MLDFKNGEIILSQPQLIISGCLRKQTLQAGIPELIISSYTVNEYCHYHVWCDIESDEYIFADVCFANDTLVEVRLYPQHKTQTAAQKQISNMDLETARELMHAWCEKFQLQNMEYPWGTVSINLGADPIYSPPNILICYNPICYKESL